MRGSVRGSGFVRFRQVCHFLTNCAHRLFCNVFRLCDFLLRVAGQPSVASAYEFSSRLEDLSWAHHQEAAALFGSESFGRSANSFKTKPTACDLINGFTDFGKLAESGKAAAALTVVLANLPNLLKPPPRTLPVFGNAVFSTIR